MSDAVWQKEAPTEPGYYWVRYVDMQGAPKEPEIMWLVEPGRAFDFGSEHAWTPGNTGCFEYGPKIELPNHEDPALREMIEAEREACAKACEESANSWPDNPEFGSYGEFDVAANAIRARKEKSQ